MGQEGTGWDKEQLARCHGEEPRFLPTVTGGEGAKPSSTRSRERHCHRGTIADGAGGTPGGEADGGSC